MPADVAKMDDDASNSEPVELPRLTILHLMTWTAATAAAFVPYRLLQHVDSIVADRSSAQTAIAVAYGVAAGAFLFVAAVTIVWRLCGATQRLQPGQWLAVHGAAQWMVHAWLWLIVFVQQSQLAATYYWASIPRGLLGAAFFFGFIWLGVRRGESAWWRLCYIVIAVAPALSTLVAFVGQSRLLPYGFDNAALFRLIYAAAAALQGLAVAAAMLGDMVARRPRHWSHWIGASARLFLQVAMTLHYAIFRAN
jgi:hypothetical protein